MTNKKQILLVNDMAGHSKVGMGAMVPVLSYFGFPTFNLPTALVSNTFDYGKFNVLDTTEYIRGTLDVWHELGFCYDAVCTGCMFSEQHGRHLLSASNVQGTRCHPKTLSEQCHRRHALHGEGLAGGTAGDAAAQMEAQASGSYHH